MKSNWISVKDRLPEKGVTVLIYYNFNEYTWISSEPIIEKIILTSKYCPPDYPGEFFWLPENRFAGCDGVERLETKHVSHWMPLPEPPNKGE